MAKGAKGIEFTQKISRDSARVLTADAMQFVANLHRAFHGEWQRLLALRAERQTRHDKGELPDFRVGTSAIRDGNWKAAALPRDLLDARVGIVSAPSRKEILLALNSGAKICLADFADFTSPGWDNLVSGQINLMDRWTSAMDHTDPATGKRMSLSQRLAVLFMRPRPLHLDEPRVKLDGRPVTAGLFDAGLYLFHNAKVALAKASGPYLCLSGIESAGEARLWNDILVHAQSMLGLPVGSIRLNVMVDSLGGAFDMDQIIHELRDHIASLSLDASRFGISLIRSFAMQKTRIVAIAPTPDMPLAGHLIRTAHKRGCLALSAMLRDSSKGEAERAVRDGFDGIWTSHCDQVPGAAKIFNDDMPTPNQIYVTRDDAAATQKDILHFVSGPRTEENFRHNVRAALTSYERWLDGRGTIDIDGMIHDSASAEFCRAQLWQWLRHGVTLDKGKATETIFEQCLAEALKQLKSPEGRFKEAAVLLKSMVLSKTCEPDFTVSAMRKLA